MNSEERIYRMVQTGELCIDSQGRIWRMKIAKGNSTGGRTITPCKPRRAERKLRDGYLEIRMQIDGTVYRALAHRLVYLNFKGRIEGNLVINHKNGIKSDNRPENLEVVTLSQNSKHATNVLGVGRCANQSGEKNHASKVTQEQVNEIRIRRSYGERLESIALDYNVSAKTISKIVRGDTWRDDQTRASG